MLRITTIFSLLVITGCIVSKKYQHQDIIEQQTDVKGRIKLKKYRQLISWPSGDGIATITQEYDSLGRVIKEYGYNNPSHPSKQYLIENIYKGSDRYIFNRFLWSEIDSNAFFTDYNKNLDIQWIFLDTATFKKEIIITILSKDSEKFIAKYKETSPISSNSWTSDTYEFELQWTDLKFDTDRRLVLDKIKK